jgi:predicted metal-dependent peptidase
MATIKDRKARERIVRARTNLLVSNGFFGFLALQLKLVEATDEKVIPTMAVDGVHIFYNPKFTNELTERECEGVVVHELMHCAFKHFIRRGSRDPLLWNIAGDYVINLDICDAGFTLPGKPLSLKELVDLNVSKKEKTYLYDASLKGVTTEAVYAKLMQHAKQISMMVGKGGKGNQSSKDLGGCGAVLDAPGNSSEQEEVEQTWETSVRIAVETARANGCGNLPGSLKSLVEQLKRPKVSWREKTRQFMDQSMTKDVSWSRLSRRSAAIGCLMPGYVADRLRQLVFFVDTSGSISFEMAREMISEVGGALDEGTADEIIVCYADTKVQHVDHFYPGDAVTVGRYTGGGTDFEDSFRWLKENAPDASAVIYLTDLQVNKFGEEPGCPVLWATYASEGQFDHLADRVPFGKAIHVDNLA